MYLRQHNQINFQSTFVGMYSDLNPRYWRLVEQSASQDLLTEKARDMLVEKGVGNGSTITFAVDSAGIASAVVTFNGKSR